MTLKASLSTALLLAALPFSSPTAIAQSDAFAVFATASEESSVAVDYSPYEEFFSVLSVQERGRTLVAYDAVRENAWGFMETYTRFLSGVDVTQLSRDDQLAFWLNTRNFLVVKALTEESSLRRFDDKRGTPGEPGPLWTAQQISVNGTSLSIQDIEQNILLSGWDSPYVLYGLYQGLEGGPVLPAEPFEGATVHAMLAEIAADFTDDRDIFRVRRGDVRLGEFYEWYAPIVFMGDTPALIEHVREAAMSDDDFTSDAEVSFKNMSSTVEQFRPRNVNNGLGSGDTRGGVDVGRGS